jgi:outer membrane lipoprotein SlyB
MEAAVSRPRLHPLLATAAISVIAFSAAGVAAVTGILPKSIGATPEIAAASQPWQPSGAPLAPAASLAAPAPSYGDLSAPEVQPAPAPKKKTVARTAPRAAKPAAPVEPAVPVSHPGPVAAAEPVLAPPAPVAQARAEVGTVQSVVAVKEKGEGTWMGPVAGGIGGAILGSQIGKGNTRTIAGVLGAAGGAYAGREIEKHVRSTTHWNVSVRMEDGSTRTVSYKTQPAFREGERVRYVDGQLVAESRA